MQIFKVIFFITLFFTTLFSNEFDKQILKKQLSSHIKCNQENKDSISTKYDFKSSYGFPSNNSLLTSFKDARIAIAVWIDDLGKNHGGKLDVRFFDDITKMYAEYKKDNGLDMIVVDLPFYFAHKKEINTLSDNFWSVSFSDNNYIQYYFVANKKSNIKSFKDIKDKTVALKSREKGSFDWLDKNSYLLNKKSYKNIVRTTIIERKESTALLKVFFNKVDFTIISSRTWDLMLKSNPLIENRVKIVKKSKRIHLPFIGFFSKKSKKNGVDAFFHLCTDMKKIHETKQMITLLKFKSVFKVTQPALNELEDCYNQYFNLQKKLGLY